MITGELPFQSSMNAPPGTLRRGLLLGAVLAVWMLGLVVRLYQLQIIQYSDLFARAQRQQQRTVEVASKRGAILDRDHQPLAMSLAVDSVFAVPGDIPNRELTARLLASALGVDASDLRVRLEGPRSFCWVKRKVTSEEAARVRGLNLRGVYFEREMKRFYPKGNLAAQVLGYVGVDDQGLAGVEYGLDESIRGRAQRVLLATDARRQSFHSTEGEGLAGKTVVLTLDQNIQSIAEKELARALRQWRAPSGTVIVQNPATGEILAMASRPTFDPNQFQKSSPQARINRAVSWVYEPGSTFKLVTVAASLEEKLTTPREVIDCQQGQIVLAGHVIHDHKKFGALTVKEILAQSSDVGVIKLALRLGSKRMYSYMQRFGFGKKTEVELPGEERGLLKPPTRWSGISIGEMSMGQEVGVTPLQIVAAYSALANGGVLFQPRLVRQVFREAKQELMPPIRGRRVVSKRTAELMRDMLADTVESGSGIKAQPNGYSAAGKTGTAQKIDASGRYSKRHYVVSFVGFAPVRQPAVTILVVIDSPVGAIYGSEVAAPVFKSIAEQTLGYLNVPHHNPSRWPQVVPTSPAKFARQQRAGRAGILHMDNESLGAAPLPVRPVSFTSPPPYARRETMVPENGALVRVPDFSGLSARQIVEECQELGLDVYLRGSGLAVAQSPPRGSRVPAGTPVWVQFAR